METWVSFTVKTLVNFVLSFLNMFYLFILNYTF